MDLREVVQKGLREAKQIDRRFRVTEKIGAGLCTAAMWTPPWNIFWWTVGGVLYTVTGAAKSDTSGDGALGMVLGAPVTLPAMPFMMVRDYFENRRSEKEDQAYRDAAEWIANQLRSRGIKVQKAEGGKHWMRIEAELRTDQVDAYRSVYAAAIRKYSDFAVEHICSDAEPLSPFNRAWAEQVGIDQFAEETFTSPCINCAKVNPCGYRFGRAPAQTMLDRYQFEWNRYTFRNRRKQERIARGYVCGDCIRDLKVSTYGTTQPPASGQSESLR